MIFTVKLGGVGRKIGDARRKIGGAGCGDI